jgi:hypothetical protein
MKKIAEGAKSAIAAAFHSQRVEDNAFHSGRCQKLALRLEIIQPERL